MKNGAMRPGADPRSILLAALPVAAEVKLRAALPDAQFVTVPEPRLSRETLGSLTASAAVVSIGGNVEAAFRLVRELVAAHLRVVVVGPMKDPDVILRAMREGAHEFVVAADEEALARALREQIRPSRTTNVGSVYVAFPAKGGVGATTIATNLAGALQRSGRRTCLVDLNLNMGDVLAFLDLAGGYSISDVVTNMRRLDRELLDATLLRHGSGIHVLAQSHRVEEADRVEASAVPGLLQFLRQHYQAVVVDGIRSFDELSVAAVDGSDRILLVLTQEVPSVRDARRCGELLKRLGHEAKLTVVVNRYQKSHIDLPVIADSVGLPVAATVANDYPAVIGSVNRGVLLADEAPRAQVTKDVDGLLRVLGLANREASAEKRSLISRFFAARTSDAAE